MNLIKIHTGAPLSGKVNHSMIHSPSRFYHRLGRKRGPKAPNLLADGFASIAFGYPNANFGGSPQTPVFCFQTHRHSNRTLQSSQAESLRITFTTVTAKAAL